MVAPPEELVGDTREVGAHSVEVRVEDFPVVVAAAAASVAEGGDGEIGRRCVHPS